MSTNQPCGLAALEQRIEEDFHWLNIPNTKPWTIDNRPAGCDNFVQVAIIGAGMSGLVAALGLRLKGVNAELFDKAVAGAEGPWRSPALMQTLRSPKEVVGPVLGSAGLAFQAWYRAQYGAEAWQQLDKIPRLQWADYLDWYRQVTKAKVHNQYALSQLTVQAKGSWLTFQTPHGEQVYFARYVVLALGMNAFAGHNIPDFVKQLPADKWIHSYDEYDYQQLAGKDIAVIGASAAAMDTAATALEAGAKSAELLIRAADFARVNLAKQAGNQGYLNGYQYLSDAQKWHIYSSIAAARTPPPQGSTLRLAQHPTAYFNFSCAINSIEQRQQKLLINTSQGNYRVDFLILATGYSINWQLNPVFKPLADKALLWRDVYQPSPEQQNTELALYPYVTNGFALQAKPHTPLPGIERIYCFSFPAGLSVGSRIGLIHGVNEGANKLTEDLVGRLYAEDFAEHWQRAITSEDVELTGSEWQPAVAQQLRTQST